MIKQNLKTLLIVALLMSSICTMATGSTLIVELTNGKHFVFHLKDNPIVTLPMGNLSIETQTQQIYISRKEVANCHFASESDAMENAVKESIVFKQNSDSHLTVGNLPDNVRIVVCDSFGHLRQSCVIQNGREAFVDLSGCPRGVYIVKIGNLQSIKIMKK